MATKTESVGSAPRGAVDGLVKGMPNDLATVPIDTIAQMGWNLLTGDVSLPSAVLHAAAIEHNIRWMQHYVGTLGAHLAPHGKTTMAPVLMNRQLAAGAWGMTAATMQQVRVMRESSITRILLANQLLQVIEIRYICSELNDPTFEFYCLVDSIAGCRLLARHLRQFRAPRPLDVLIELGIAGRRTGCRSASEATQLAAEIDRHRDVLQLAGIEGYEGLISGDNHTDTERNINAYLDEVVSTARTVAGLGFIKRNSMLLSAGGSGHFDLVSQKLCSTNMGTETEVVLRSGCYISHDHQHYRELQARMHERDSSLGPLDQGLWPALEVWALVQSRPEPGPVICNLGKRDAGIDYHPPKAMRWYRQRNHPAPQAITFETTTAEVNDQHCNLTVSADCPLEVGDLVAFGISHPCTTFDRWQTLLLVNESYDVIDVVQTFF